MKKSARSEAAWAKWRGLVEEQEASGLSVHAFWHYDTMTSGAPPTAGPDRTVNSDDHWYYFCFDERWRIVATFRGSDANPKEAFVRHAAGLDGRGGSSYIDSMVLRDRDANTAWTTQSDGTLEERVYYCQNWRGDVSVLLTEAGTMLEWVKYLAYGRQYGYPGGDVDGNGHCNVDDATALINLMAVSGYHVRADVNLDGDADSNDFSYFSSGSMAWGTLSLVGNRFGYAGYHHASELAGTKWDARNRMLDSVTGVWNRRDPLGYVDGMNLYQYVKGMAIVARDPLGLAGCGTTSVDFTASGGLASCGGGGGEPPPPPPPASNNCAAAIEAVQENPLYQELISTLASLGCPVPPIVCVDDCPPGAVGWNDGTSIFVCANQPLDEQVITILHEMIHAVHNCNRGGHPMSCEQLLCSELIAAKNSGECAIGTCYTYGCQGENQDCVNGSRDQDFCAMRKAMDSICCAAYNPCCNYLLNRQNAQDPELQDIAISCLQSSPAWPLLPWIPSIPQIWD